MHLVPGCPAHVLLPLLVLLYNMFEQINNQSINQTKIKNKNGIFSVAGNVELALRRSSNRTALETIASIAAVKGDHLKHLNIMF